MRGLSVVADRAFGIARSALLRQINVRIVASGAGEMRIVGVVTTATGEAIRLKTYVVDPA